MFRHIFIKLKTINIWHFLWIAIVFSEIFTALFNSILSLIFSGKVSQDLLLIGSIDAFIVPLIVTPVVIYFIKHTERLRDINEQLQDEIEERKQLEKSLHALSVTDELTHIYNRWGFFTLAEHKLKIADRREKEILLLIIDIDNLKMINDKYGHNEGDRTLIETSEILKESFRDIDIVARTGGDEFIILQIADADVPYETIISRLKNNLKIYNKRESLDYKLSISIGWSIYNPKSPCSLDELIAQADKLMCDEKQIKKSLS